MGIITIAHERDMPTFERKLNTMINKDILLIQNLNVIVFDK